MPICAICSHLSLAPRPATGTVGVLTGEPAMLSAAVDRFGLQGAEEHILIHACPEHAVDVYRGRVTGMRMAWRLSEALTPPQSPVAASSSRA